MEIDIWKLDAVVAWKGSVLTAVYDLLRGKSATEEDLDMFYRVCSDMEALIRMSDAIPEQYKKEMITEVQNLSREWKGVVKEYFQNRNKH